MKLSFVFSMFVVIFGFNFTEASENFYDLTEVIYPQTFSRSPQNPRHQKVWDNTFMIYAEQPNSNLATIFLVDKFNFKGYTFAAFATAGHVVQMMQDYKRSFILKDVVFAGMPTKRSHIKSLTNVPMEVLMSVQEAEHGMVYVRLPQDIGEQLQPVEIAQSCEIKAGETLATIGFPITKKIRHLRSPAPGDDLELIAKRSSTGVFVGDVGYINGNGSYPIYGTTIDSIGGGSGGPVLNTEGQVVGFMSMGNSALEYKGADNTNVEGLKSRTYMVRCQEMKKFFNDKKNLLSHLAKVVGDDDLSISLK